MSDPCNQEQNIAHILHALERMETNQERLVTLMEKVANQDARIIHVEEHAENAYKDMNEIFTRLRECELNQAANGHDRLNETLEELGRKVDSLATRFEKILSFHKIATSKPALYAYAIMLGMLLFGFSSDLWNHWEWVKLVWSFWK